MPYCSLFYHIVWSTKNRLPLIEAAWEENLYGYIRGKAIALECKIHAINGMADHTHVVISIPPKLAVATLVGHLKGASSHHVNENFVTLHSFAWQSEYGAFTFSEKSLSQVVNYVINQKKHHAGKGLDRSFENFQMPKQTTNIVRRMLKHPAPQQKDDKPSWHFTSPKGFRYRTWKFHPQADSGITDKQLQFIPNLLSWENSHSIDITA